MEPDGLSAFPEIFVGLAGFTGIALALKPNPKPYFLFRVIMIVSISMISIVVSLIPAPLLAMGWSQAAIWQASSGILVVFYAVLLPFVVVYRRRAGGDELVGWLNFVLTAFVLVNVLVQTINVFGVFDDFAYAVMFFGLVGTFIHCAVLFMVLITFGRLESAG